AALLLGAAYLPAKIRAPATQATTAMVAAIMGKLMLSPSMAAANASPMNGGSSCNCPTAAMPPCAKPRYQKIKPISMLNRDTYPRPIQAGTLMCCQARGSATTQATAMKGSDNTKAQEITSHPPIWRDSRPPSAYP